MLDELFTEHRVKITKCFRVSDRLVPSGVDRLHSDLYIRECQNPNIMNYILKGLFSQMFTHCIFASGTET